MLSLSPRSCDCSGASSASAATPSVTIAVSASAPSNRGRRPKKSGARRGWVSLALGNAIAGSTDGDDQARFLGGRLELLAQMADVNVDRARVAIRGVAPDRAQQLLAVEQAAGLAHQAREQLE